jgi:hypothetical protein
MLENTEDKADPVERKPSPTDSVVAKTRDLRETKARGRRKRRKPFVL